MNVNQTYTVTKVVDKESLASTVGSGLLDVFSTPSMVALMELAASSCIQGELEEGQCSVGTGIQISHDMATPLGIEVRATATITAIDRRRVDFQLVAETDAGIIGKGTHTRFIVDSTSFMEKAEQQNKKK